MSNKTDGGPAFPNNGDNTPTHPFYDGMSLRDYFAAKAMEGLLSASSMLAGNNQDLVESYLRNIPSVSFQFADAMLAERDK